MHGASEQIKQFFARDLSQIPFKYDSINIHRSVWNFRLNNNAVHKYTHTEHNIQTGFTGTLYGSGNWTAKEEDKNRITASEMKFIRITAKYAWMDYKGNEDVLNEL